MRSRLINGAIELMDFRPIGLVSGVYKIIASLILDRIIYMYIYSQPRLAVV